MKGLIGMLCHALEYNTDEYWDAWSVTAEFAIVMRDCNMTTMKLLQEFQEEKQRAEDEGREYDWRSYPGGPIIQTLMMMQVGWEMLIHILMKMVMKLLKKLIGGVIEDKWKGVKLIGPLPTSFINNGNASVVNGTVVYDPTP